MDRGLSDEEPTVETMFLAEAMADAKVLWWRGAWSVCHRHCGCLTAPVLPPQPSAQRQPGPPCHPPRSPACAPPLRPHSRPLALAALRPPRLYPAVWLAATSEPPRCHPHCPPILPSPPGARAGVHQPPPARPPQGRPPPARWLSAFLRRWTWEQPQRREGPLRLWAGPPLPQPSLLNPGPGALPQRPTERACSSATTPQHLLPPTCPPRTRPSPFPRVGASSLCLQVPRCPLGRPPRQGGLGTVLHFQTFFFCSRPGLGGPSPHSQLSGRVPREPPEGRRGLPAPTGLLFFSCQRIVL